MDDKIIIFQIGSVKDFVNSSRKTRDYWAGSFLLSFLNLIAIKTFEDKFANSIVYPYVEQNDLSKLAENFIKGGEINFSKINHCYGSLPNRFTAIVNGEDSFCEEALKKCKNNIDKFLKEIIQSSKEYIEKEMNKLSNNQYWNEIWERQSKEILPIYWSISEYNTQANYEKNYTNAELLFAGKKNMRLFENIAEPGFKCTICGTRQICIDGSRKSTYKYYNDFWDELRKKFSYDFKENERLCSVCISRRLFPKVKKLNITFPSTSTISTMPFIFFLENRYEDLSPDIKQIEEILFNKNIDYEKNYLFNDSDSKFYNLDGDYFILSNYDNDKFWDKSFNLEERKKIKECLENLIELSEEVKVKTSISKYYSVVKFDFDNLGKKIEESKNKDEHKKLSEDIYNFLSKTLKKIVDSIKYAKIIYAGGDEGIIFVHLDYLFDFLYLLRSCFKGNFNFNSNKQLDEIKKCNEIFNGYNLTISTGVVVAHHQESLKDVLNELENTLKIAKSDKFKDRISFTIMKRSGEIIRDLTFDWLWKQETIIIKYLKDLQEMYKNDYISGNLVYDLKSLFFVHKKETEQDPIKIFSIDSPSILKYFTYRNIKKNTREEDKIKLNKIIDEISKIEDFTKLLTLASYISGGGGA